MLNFRTATIIGLAAAIPLSSGHAASALTAAEAMAGLGAQGEAAFSSADIGSFGAVFDRMDGNRDGQLTEAEYTAASRHFSGNPAGARGFLRASDNDADGLVSRGEYIRNRIVTDEAKEIFTRIAPGEDWAATPAFQWSMDRDAFVSSDLIGDGALAASLFDAMDGNGDGVLQLPEYLIAYGRWARDALPAAALDGL